MPHRKAYRIESFATVSASRKRRKNYLFLQHVAGATNFVVQPLQIAQPGARIPRMPLGMTLTPF
jgi:hypothetical protein